MPFANEPKSGTGKTVTVFGGSGFVGRSVVRQLAKRGYQVCVAVRRPDLAHYLQPLGNVGQIELVQANLRDAPSVESAVRGADHVVNLVGIAVQSGKQRFDAIQHAGAKLVAEMARKHNAGLVHMSAIGADANSLSLYAKSKGLGEEAVRKAHPSAIIMRPSVIFGEGDGFFERFGAMAQVSPFLPLIGGGKTMFQPVYVGDVANAVANGVDGSLSPKKTYELGGPQALTFRQSLDLLQEQVGRAKGYIHLPFWAAKLLARLTSWLPGAPITLDQCILLETDNVVSDKAKREKRILEGAGVTPTTMSAVLPTYLVKYRPHGQFTKLEDQTK